MLNQVKIFSLILEARAFFPLDFLNVITGAKFTLNIASYILS